jgi:hypothetical protein
MNGGFCCLMPFFKTPSQSFVVAARIAHAVTYIPKKAHGVVLLLSFSQHCLFGKGKRIV